jgi:hypothetical protein
MLWWLLDDAVYYTCCSVVLLHSFSALLVITHGRCSVYAAAFLIACAMWIDLNALNLWFFLPTIVKEASRIELDLTGNYWTDAASVTRDVLLSPAASYLFMMLFGWFVGSMSLSNALSMWQREGCDAMDSHSHSGVAAYVIQLTHRVEELVGITDAGYLPLLEAEESRTRSRWSCIFAVPRLLHPYYVVILPPPIRLLGNRGERSRSLEEKS